MSRISSRKELDLELGDLSEVYGLDEGSGIRRRQPRVGGRGAAPRGQTERRDQCDEQCSPDQRRVPIALFLFAATSASRLPLRRSGPRSLPRGVCRHPRSPGKALEIRQAAQRMLERGVQK
jgi:hypothetical protein